MLKKKIITYLFAASSVLAILNGLPPKALAMGKTAAKIKLKPSKASRKHKTLEAGTGVAGGGFTDDSADQQIPIAPPLDTSPSLPISATITPNKTTDIPKAPSTVDTELRIKKINEKIRINRVLLAFTPSSRQEEARAYRKEIGLLEEESKRLTAQPSKSSAPTPISRFRNIGKAVMQQLASTRTQDMEGPPQAPPMDEDGPPQAPPMDEDGPPPPPPTDAPIPVTDKLHNRSLPLYERFNILFSAPKAPVAEAIGSSAINTSALMAELISNMTAIERLQILRDAKKEVPRRGTAPVPAPAAAPTLTFKEELAKKVIGAESRGSSSTGVRTGVKVKTVEEWIQLADEIKKPLTDKQKDFLRHGELLKSQGQDFTNLNMKDRQIIAESNMLISNITKAKSEYDKAQILQKKAKVEAEKARIEADPVAKQRLLDEAIKRKAEAVSKADAKVVSLKEAQKSVDNISGIHSRLISYGAEQRALRDKSPQRHVVSAQLLKKLVKVAGIVPTGMEMYEKSKAIQDFEEQEKEQLSMFMTESLPPKDRQTLKELLKPLNKNGSLDMIVEALSSVSKDEIVKPSTETTASSSMNNELLESIRKGVKLRKASTPPPQGQSLGQAVSGTIVQPSPQGAGIGTAAPAATSVAALKTKIAAVLGSRSKDSKAIRTPLTLDKIKTNPLEAYLQLQYEGRVAWLADKGLSKSTTDPVAIITKPMVLELAQYGIVPTPLEIYGVRVRDKVKLITSKSEEIRIAKLKDFITSRAITEELGTACEAFIEVLARDDQELGRELRTVMSPEEIQLLKIIDVELGGMTEEQAQKLAEERAKQAAKMAEVLKIAKKAREEGMARLPLADSTAYTSATTSASSLIQSSSEGGLDGVQPDNNTTAQLNTVSVTQPDPTTTTPESINTTQNISSISSPDEKEDDIDLNEFWNMLGDEDEGDPETTVYNTATSMDPLSLVTADIASILKGKTDDKEKAELVNIRLAAARKYEAITTALNNPNNIVELIKSLRQEEIKLPELEGAAEDNVVENLSNTEKASAYVAAMQNLSAEDIVQEQQKTAIQSAITPTALVSNLASGTLIERVIGADGSLIKTATTDKDLGIAAGDEESSSSKGIWISGLLGTSKLDTPGGQAGYKNTSSGFMAGIDTSFGEKDTNLIGLAYGQVHSNFKMKNHRRKGNKIKSVSHIFSIYGQTEIANNLLLQATGFIINSKVTTKSGKLIGANKYKTATGKFDSSGFNLNSSLSYVLKTDNFVLMPSLGLKYGKTSEGAYNETGTGIYNLSVTSKSSDNLSGVIGFKIMVPKNISENIHIAPGLQASMEKQLNSREKAAKVKLAWANKNFDDVIKNPQEKIGYNIGSSLLVKHKNIEVVASYNYHFKKHYSSHQGAIKLEIKF